MSNAIIATFLSMHRHRTPDVNITELARDHDHYHGDFLCDLHLSTHEQKKGVKRFYGQMEGEAVELQVVSLGWNGNLSPETVIPSMVMLQKFDPSFRDSDVPGQKYI